MPEPELMITRRSFPAAQKLLAGEPSRLVGVSDVGWHDTAADPETGAVALVRDAGPYEELIGEVLRVTRPGVKPVFVYVAGRAQVAADLSLARRAFFALAPLSEETLRVTLEVV